MQIILIGQSLHQGSSDTSYVQVGERSIAEGQRFAAKLVRSQPVVVGQVAQLGEGVRDP